MAIYRYTSLLLLTTCINYTKILLSGKPVLWITTE